MVNGAAYHYLSLGPAYLCFDLVGNMTERERGDSAGTAVNLWTTTQRIVSK